MMLFHCMYYHTWYPMYYHTWYPMYDRTWHPMYDRTWHPMYDRTWYPMYDRTWYPMYDRTWYPMHEVFFIPPGTASTGRKRRRRPGGWPCQALSPPAFRVWRRPRYCRGRCLHPCLPPWRRPPSRRCRKAR